MKQAATLNSNGPPVVNRQRKAAPNAGKEYDSDGVAGEPYKAM